MSESGQVSITEEESAAAAIAEISSTEKVLAVVSRKNAFPTLCTSATFVSNVVKNCGDDFSYHNISQNAFELAQGDDFLAEIQAARRLRTA